MARRPHPGGSAEGGGDRRLRNQAEFVWNPSPTAYSLSPRDLHPWAQHFSSREAIVPPLELGELGEICPSTVPGTSLHDNERLQGQSWPAKMFALFVWFLLKAVT